VLCVGTGLVSPRPALADTLPAPRPPALLQAREAWAKKAFEPAATAYQKALDNGSLSPDEVREAYVRIGTAFAAIRKTTPALDAFRMAATLDIDFTVPLDAPKRAMSLADRAKREAKREKPSLGKMTFAASIPSSVRAGQRFAVDATLDASHVPAVIRVTISVRDTLTNREYTHAALPAPAVRLEVPVAMTMPNGVLDVRVDAIDLHSNRLASVEKRVRVAPVAVYAAAVDTQQKEKERDRGGGFWSSPWPWFIGAGIVAAGGASAR
jgi:hypothetical protein